MPLDRDFESPTTASEGTTTEARIPDTDQGPDLDTFSEPGGNERGPSGADRRPGESGTSGAAAPAGSLGSDSSLEIQALLQSREREHARELAEREERVAAMERRYQQAVRERELATALAGRPLVPGAASQLVKLWSAEFDVYEEGGATRVASRDGRSVAKAVSDWLSSPEYAHFSLSTSRGGTNPPGANRAAQGVASASRPGTLGDAAIHRWRESVKGLGADTSTPIGLHRRH